MLPNFFAFLFSALSLVYILYIFLINIIVMFMVQKNKRLQRRLELLESGKKLSGTIEMVRFGMEISL